MTEYYGHPITDFVHPGDVADGLERIAALTEDGQFFEHGEARIISPDGTVTVMEITSIRTTWGGEPAFQVILPRRVGAAGRRGRCPLPGQPGGPRVRRHHRHRRRRAHRVLERGRAVHLRLDRGRGGRPVHRDGGDGQPVGQRRHPRTRAPHPPSQGRFLGRRAGLDRPAHRRHLPAFGLGGGVHRAHRRPPGRSRTSGGRGALRGGRRLAERGHHPLRRCRQGQRPQPGCGVHPRQPSDGGERPPPLHRVVHRHLDRGVPPHADHVPPRQDSGHRRVRGRRGHRRNRRPRPAPVAVDELAPPVRRQSGRLPHGGLLVHRRDRP